MVTITDSCRYCGNQDQVRRKGLSTNGVQPHPRTGYKCDACTPRFQLAYAHKAHELGIKEKGIDMALDERIRQYIPKGCSISIVKSGDVTWIQDQLNHQPRRALGFLTPIQFAQKQEIALRI